MKKLVTLIALSILLLTTKQMYAQREYWGVTFAGGSSYKNYSSYDSIGLGVIFKTDKYGNNQQVVYSFDSLSGIRPDGMLTEGPNGKLYGFATQLSPNSGGCLYEFNSITYQYRIIKSFIYLTTGYNPNLHPGVNGGKPLLASNGKIYGTYTSDTLLPPVCNGCPDNNIGRYTKIFEYNPTTDVFTNVYTFKSQTVISNGTLHGKRYGPGGPSRMMQAANGKIYMPFPDGGEEFGGYTTAVGSLYEFIPNTNKVTLLYSYGLGNGAEPGAAMTEYSPGVMYNTFNYGSTEQMNKGGIHKYDVATNTMSIVAYVDTITGAYISGTLVKVGNKLYGTTVLGGWAPVPWTPWYERQGILFEFNPATNEIKKVYDYGYQGNLTPNQDTHGLSLNLLAFNDTLFGITQYTMFQYKISTSEIKHLMDFNGPNGLSPQTGTGLIQTCTKPHYTTYTTDTITATLGQNLTFTIHTPNTDSFNWVKNNIPTLINDSTLSLNPVAVSDTGTYICQLKNECGTVNAKNIYIKVSSTLPVTLTNFTAALVNKNAQLNWQTSSEYNNHYFQIQRSINGTGFTTIGSLNGNGTTNLVHNYKFTDINFLQTGAAFYRLKQVDFDGNFTYSTIKYLQLTAETFTVSVNPNPATNSFALTLPSNFNDVQISIYNSKAALIKQQICKGGNTIFYTGNWPAGQYLIKLITDNGNIITRKIIVTK